MKFKNLRLLLDDLNSIVNGWYTRIVTSKQTVGDMSTWYLIADFPTKIKWRDELGELNENRISNMERSCGIIDGILLHPREVFSVQKVIGEPTKERGFKEGPNIVGGQLSCSVGGGLCQISTALFNVALLANVQILQKHNHSADIWGENRFIDLGKDATYVYAQRDLKFKNDHPADIAVRMSVDRNDLLLNCQIYSPRELPYKVEIKHRVLKELEPRSVGNAGFDPQKGRKGWVVLTERFIIKSSGVRKLTFSKTDTYKPILLQ
ncbi:MAG: VanW family protein [candidate division WOR-3 bacterium]|nr:VanW family protein [candidate division WOR-3 bacterium]